MPLLAGVGVLGGLLRDCAPDTEDIWRFSPFFDLSLYRLFKQRSNHRRTVFHLASCSPAILLAEFLRQALGVFSDRPELLLPASGREHPQPPGASSRSTSLRCSPSPAREDLEQHPQRSKLEQQERLLIEARLDALTSQINPHFLFNTLNSVSSLIRTNPNQARVMVLQLSNICAACCASTTTSARCARS